MCDLHRTRAAPKLCVLPGRILRLVHVRGRPKLEITGHVGPPCDFVANRMNFSLRFSEKARAADMCTYQVCLLTPSGHKVVFSQRLLKIMDFL